MLKEAPGPSDPPKKVRTGFGRSVRLGVAAAIVAVLAACGRAPAEPTGPVFPVTLKDFWTETETNTSAPGMVTLRVSNEGTATHEFVLVRTDLPADALPLGPDGLSVDESGLEPLAELEAVPAGTTVDLVVPMDPGSYVIFCNLEGHYLSGMRDPLLVTDGSAPAAEPAAPAEAEDAYR
jgi:hypothetical protein